MVTQQYDYIMVTERYVITHGKTPWKNIVWSTMRRNNVSYYYKPYKYSL